MVAFVRGERDEGEAAARVPIAARSYSLPRTLSRGLAPPAHRWRPASPALLTALWISRDATVLGYCTIAHHAQRHTRAEFGRRLEPASLPELRSDFHRHRRP